MNASDLLRLSESKVNATEAAQDLASWLRTERGVIIQVEVFFVLSVVLHAVQVVFGWWRRCSSNSYIKYSLWLAYTINPVLVMYTLGLARSSPPSAGSELLQACALPFVMALGSTNSMTAYSVDDNKQYMRHFVQQVLRVMSLFAIWRTNYEPKLTTLKFVLVLIYLFLSVLMLSMNGGRIYASMIASSFLDKQSRNVQVHMSTKHTGLNYHNPRTMIGYNYLFWEEIFSDGEHKVTVDRIWISNEGPLGSSDGKQLKEACLSFALFRLLRRRFFGLACPESKLEITRDLVFNGLLSEVQHDYESTYRIIEVELAFLHDHFFTSSGSFNAKLGNVIIILSIAKVIMYPVTILFSIKDFIHNRNERNNSTWMVLVGGFDPILTALLIMLVLLALELLQLYLYLSSDWAKIRLVRRSIYHFSELQRRWSIWSIFGEDSCFGIFGFFVWLGIDRYFIKLPRILGYWQNKIAQHALVKDLHRRSYIADIMGSISGCFFGECLEYHPVFSRGIFSPGIKGPHLVQLTSDVKLALALALKTSKGHLSNGENSLKRNKQHVLSWACKQQYHTSTMLIWHVATEYCDIAECREMEEQYSSVPSHTLAKTLSSYCAYLMAFVPELLPDEELDTRLIFDEVRCQAKRILSNRTTLDDKYTTMRNFDQHPSDERIFVKGIRLGRELEAIRHDKRWKILADFWAEMILYIAPSSNAKAHIERLAHGGEFLTHLWALLFHAGIVEREE
ncbi:hypothetical protein QOZ80_3BG0277840 [Eleusine coracana subsp. coracana]|nr:hypothetical protein QOZ80_3BG0277840 [Eleusine coracana subsp. coracana]